MADYYVNVDINQKALEDAINNGEGLPGILQGEVDKITSRANSLSSGMRTGRFYDRAKGMQVGNTQPEFKGGVKMGKKGYVGIVYTANYAAQKANYESNVLLKAKG